MLALTRGPGEKVLINPGEMGQITVTVERLMGGRARLTFQAPRSVVIHRGEVWEQRKADGRRSA